MRLRQALSLLVLPAALAADILKTEGFTSCMENAQIRVNSMDIEYDRASNLVTFDVSGTSEIEQEVVATLIVSAYGKEVYKREFDPCDEGTKVEQLCPGKQGPVEEAGRRDGGLIDLCGSTGWDILRQWLADNT